MVSFSKRVHSIQDYLSKIDLSKPVLKSKPTTPHTNQYIQNPTQTQDTSETPKNPFLAE